MTKSISASQRRCSSRLSSDTQLLSYPFELKRKFQRCLMLPGTLFVRAAQALLDQADIESRAFGFLDCTHGQIVNELAV